MNAEGGKLTLFILHSSSSFKVLFRLTVITLLSYFLFIARWLCDSDTWRAQRTSSINGNRRPSRLLDLYRQWPPGGTTWAALRECSELCLYLSVVARVVPFRARRGVTWVASAGLVRAVWRTRGRTKAPIHKETSNGSWCMGIKGEMSGTVCVTFTWDMYIHMSCL